MHTHTPFRNHFYCIHDKEKNDLQILHYIIITHT